jgi:hypothetical protein
MKVDKYLNIDFWMLEWWSKREADDQEFKNQGKKGGECLPA